MTLRPRHVAAYMAMTIMVVFAWTVCAFGSQAKHRPGEVGRTPALRDASPKSVDAFMATLTDAQARQLLHDKLTAQSIPEKPGSEAVQLGEVLLNLFVGIETSVRSSVGRHSNLLEAASRDISDGNILINLTGGGDVRDLLHALLVLALVCGGAYGAFAGTGRLFGLCLRRSPRVPAAANLGRAGAILGNVIRQFLSIVAFFLAAILLFVVLIPASGETRAVGIILVVVLAYFLLIQAFARVLLSPDCNAARPIPMQDQGAGTLYRWLVAIAASCSTLAASSLILTQVGKAQILGHLIYALAGPVTGLILSTMILANRERVTVAILGSREGQDRDTRSVLAKYWHFPAMAYALVVCFFWSAHALSGEATILLLVLSLFLIPCCIGVDLWVGKLLIAASGQDREIIALDADPEPAGKATSRDGVTPENKRTIRYYVPLIRKTLRSVLVVFIAFAMLKTWGIEIPLGWLFARNVLSVFLVGVIGLLLWEVVRIRIDRKLSEETSLPGEEAEEGGGAGGSRSATLLLLLRKFVLCVIVVIGSLIALSSLGVNIGPLIAGAGVVGLAIGFGAQTLVKDIISGVFFLIDDAFRVGDYVEAGTAKGTVEQISLRSMKLRHPRGMVFTIPYGGLRIIQNFSRDYIVSKLDFRVRYDANIEKIRKIIKRINKDLMSNEEISKGMLSDIKSMGVRKMEDSAMILRIKFKSIPGHQFIVEKELYRRIQEAFKENGIEFAHRNVTVYFPNDVGQNLTEIGRIDDNMRKAIGAAAASALADEKKLSSSKKQSGDE